jgi:hypothetical protein
MGPKGGGAVLLVKNSRTCFANVPSRGRVAGGWGKAKPQSEWVAMEQFQSHFILSCAMGTSRRARGGGGLARLDNQNRARWQANWVYAAQKYQIWCLGKAILMGLRGWYFNDVRFIFSVGVGGCQRKKVYVVTHLECHEPRVGAVKFVFYIKSLSNWIWYLRFWIWYLRSKHQILLTGVNPQCHMP